MTLCECGCGREVNIGKRFIRGHNNSHITPEPSPSPTLCECGCGGYANPGRRFINTHQSNVFTDEHKKNISKALKGVPKSAAHKLALSKSKKNVNISAAHRLALSKSRTQERFPLPNGLDIVYDGKVTTNKKCTHYLGCYIAERIISNIFENVQVMPYNNCGYDIICAHGMKIDIKSGCAQCHNGINRWSFNIKHNMITDYFLCIAFDNREDLNPLYMWMIPGADVNKYRHISISESKINKWNMHRLDITNVTTYCDSLR